MSKYAGAKRRLVKWAIPFFSEVKILKRNLQRPKATTSPYPISLQLYTCCPFSKPFLILLLAPMQPVPEIEIGAVSTLESLIWPEQGLQYNRTAQSTVQQYNRTAQSTVQQYNRTSQSTVQQYNRTAQSTVQQYNRTAQSPVQQYNRTAQSPVTTLLPARRQIDTHLSSTCSLQLQAPMSGPGQ